METIGSPETSVSNHYTPRYNLEDGIIQFNSGGSSRTFPGVKRPECAFDTSTLPSAEVKNEWRCTSTPSPHLHGAARF